MVVVVPVPVAAAPQQQQQQQQQRGTGRRGRTPLLLRAPRAAREGRSSRAQAAAASASVRLRLGLPRAGRATRRTDARDEDCGVKCQRKDAGRHACGGERLSSAGSGAGAKLPGALKTLVAVSAILAVVVSAALAANGVRSVHDAVELARSLAPQIVNVVVPPAARGSSTSASTSTKSSASDTPNSQQQQQQQQQPKKKRLSVKEIRERAKKMPCKDRHNAVECANMASNGNCDEAPGWMAVMCAASCGRCELLDPKIRCDPKTTGASRENAVGPGDLRRLFEGFANRTDLNVTYLSKEPYLVLFNNFITEEEAKVLLSTTDPYLARSTDQGEMSEEGIQEQVVSQGRTSSNAWCMRECEHHPVVKNLQRRIGEVVNVNPLNFEAFQVLRYRRGEKYDVHHDASPHDLSMPAGTRILTFFIYLTDVEEGGETHFPALNQKVRPQKFAALLWPSVMLDDPEQIDGRYVHAALPVVKGVKRAANTWIHQRDYTTNNIWGCTGSFSE